MAEAGKFGYACRFASTTGGIYAKLQSNAADTKVNRIRRQVKEQCSRTSLSEKDFIALQFRREAVKHFLLCYGP